MNIAKIVEVISLIKKSNYKAYLVGGSSRDFLLSRDFLDIDIATNAPLDFIKKKFKVENDDGASMGSIKISYKNLIIDITRFRKEQYDNKSSFPKVSEYLNSPYEDAIRRDFTINAIYLDVTTNEVIDPFDGLKDLFTYKIKIIGNPNERIKEDPSRILRGIRLAKKLNFEIDEETHKAFIGCKDELLRLSNSKLKKEIERLVSDLGEYKAKKLLEEYQIDYRRTGYEFK